MVMSALRKEIRNLYRCPEKGYASMDFIGTGQISQEEFLKSLICQRIPFTEEELKDCFLMTSMFKNKMNFDSFKKTFFPHLYLIPEGEESDEEKRDAE